MKSPDEVLREGELEKRSDSLFQLWKKKRGVLTSDRLSLFPASPRARPKELRFHSLLKVDCVERTGKYVYFTIVTTERKEIDFRCAGESCWNAAIALALIDFQNRRALQGFRSRQERPAPAALARTPEAAEAAAPSSPPRPPPSEPSEPSPQPQPRTP
nr:LOW QUALITY PROTEIN: pleckstrin homology-like domain family A member 2 [Aotus nancymaae]